MPERNAAAPGSPSDRRDLFSAGVEWLSIAISLGGMFRGFVESAGGLVGFLTEVFLFGFCCIAAAIPTSMIAGWGIEALEERTRRNTNDNVAIGTVVVCILAGGFLLRSLMEGQLSEEPSGLGILLAVVVGPAFIIAPLFFLWHTIGSKPR